MRWNQLSNTITVHTHGAIDGKSFTLDHCEVIEVEGINQNEVRALMLGLRLGLSMRANNQLDRNLVGKVDKMRTTDVEQHPSNGVSSAEGMRKTADENPQDFNVKVETV